MKKNNPEKLDKGEWNSDVLDSLFERIIIFMVIFMIVACVFIYLYTMFVYF